LIFKPSKADRTIPAKFRKKAGVTGVFRRLFSRSALHYYTGTQQVGYCGDKNLVEATTLANPVTRQAAHRSLFLET
jgi:hypothetical protein